MVMKKNMRYCSIHQFIKGSTFHSQKNNVKLMRALDNYGQYKGQRLEKEFAELLKLIAVTPRRYLSRKILKDQERE